jgi:transposase InsO family protein
VRFAFIEAEKAVFPITQSCAVLGVSRAGFYAWRGRSLGERAAADQRLAVEVAAIHTESQRRYGSPRVHRELRARGQHVGRKRVARLMRRQGLRARVPRRFRTTTDSRHTLPIAPNILARRFEAAAPNRVWVTDITYLWTLEGWLYLVVILDLFSRRVVGWAMSERLTRHLALDALTMALTHRQPAHGLVHHSDRGSQYASHEYRRLLAAHGIVCSMSRRGDCWDNAVAESFFSTLKLELVYESAWRTRAEARAAVFDYVEVFYNGTRLHSSLDYLSPVAFERQYEQQERAA